MAHPDTAATPADRLARAFARMIPARAGMPAPQALVVAPGFEFATGERARRFHGASIAKIMTATLAFQLAERGSVDLDAPLPTLLPEREWRGLFVVGGVDRSADVTLARLLAHTSGVADYFDGRVRRGASFRDALLADPGHAWTPAELLDWSRERQQPVAAPGARFSYSDTGYVLAARIVEEAGAASLGAQLHARILAPSGMEESCLLFHTMPGGGAAPDDPADALALAPLWLGRTEFSRARALTCDWGGGGVVSTLDDLVRFSRAWHGGALVGAASRARLAHPVHRFRPGIHCGTGVMQLRYGGFSPFLAGMPRLTGHLGVTGTHVFGDAERGIHLAMNFHSTREMVRSFRAHIDLVRAALRA